MKNMKSAKQQNFKYGNYISDMINQIANNIQLFESESEQNDFATDYISTTCSNITGVFDCEFNLLDRINKKPHSTFLVKVQGDSMENANINDGEILLVDSSVQAVNNSIVVAEINNCLTIKKIKFINKNFVLCPENPKYSPITIKKSDNFVIWGVVISNFLLQ
jgi:hypothetical protein